MGKRLKLRPFQKWSKDEIAQSLEESGILRPRKDGVIEELSEGLQSGGLQVMKGIGSTIEEVGLGSGLHDYATDVELRNQHLRPHDEYSPLSLDPSNIAYAVGSGVGQSGASMVGGIATTALTANPLAGFAVTAGTMMPILYGDKVKEFRELMPDADEATLHGWAFVSSAGESIIEAGMGSNAMAVKMTKKVVTGALKKTIKDFGKDRVLRYLKTVGVNGLKNAGGEAGEEISQAIYGHLIKDIAGVKQKALDLEELAEQGAGGFWSGLAMGGAGGVVQAQQGSAKQDTLAKPKQDAPAEQKQAFTKEEQNKIKKHWRLSDKLPAKEVADTLNTVVPNSELDERSVAVVEPKSAFTKTLAKLAYELTGKEAVYFLPNTKTAGRANGFTRDGKMYVNVDQMAENPAKITGHEFIHFWQKESPKEYSDFKQTVVDNLQANHKEYLDGKIKEYDEAGIQLDSDGAMDEFTADVMGDMFIDDKFWNGVFSSEKDQGRLQKLAHAVIRFIERIAESLKGNKDAVGYLSDLEKVRSEAVKIVSNKLDNGRQETALTELKDQADKKIAGLPEYKPEYANGAIKDLPPNLEQVPVQEKAAETKPENRFMDMDISDVKQFADSGVTLAKEALEARQDELAKMVEDKIKAKKASESKPEKTPEPVKKEPKKEDTPEVDYDKVYNTAGDARIANAELGGSGRVEAFFDEKKVKKYRIVSQEADAKITAQRNRKEVDKDGVNFHHVKTVQIENPTGKNEEQKLSNAKKMVKETVLRLAKKAPDVAKWHGNSRAGLSKVENLALSDTVRIEFPNGKGYTILNEKKVLLNFAKKIDKIPASLSAKIKEQTSDKRVRTELPKVRTKNHIKQADIEKVAKNFVGKLHERPVMQEIMHDVKKKRIIATDGKSMFIATQPKEKGWKIKQTEGMPRYEQVIPTKTEHLTTFDTAKALQEVDLVSAIVDSDTAVNVFLDTEGNLALNVKDEQNGSYKNSNIPDGAKSIGGARVKQLDTILKSFKSLGVERIKFSTGKGYADAPVLVFESPNIKIISMGVKESGSGHDVDFSLNKNWRKTQVNPFTTPEVRQAHDKLLEEYEPEHRSHAELDAKADKLIAKQGVESLVDEFVSRKRKADTDFNVRLAHKLGNTEEYWKMTRAGDSRTTQFQEFFIEDRSDAGRLLASGRIIETGDKHIDQQKAIIEFFNTFSKHYKKIKDKAKAMEKEIEIQKSIYEKLQKKGIDLFNLTKEQTDDTRLMFEAVRIMQAEKATKDDKAYEYWISAILSGFKTMGANAVGNTAMASLELVPQRATEAFINLAFKNPKGATFGEFKSMWKGFTSSIKPAFKNMKESWITERAIDDKISKLEDMHGVAIKGVHGRIIRMPLRALLSADELAKKMTGTIEASAYAHREAKAKGLKGQALDAYVAEQLADKNSDARVWGHNRALTLAFQQKLDKNSQTDMIVDWIIRMKNHGGAVGAVFKYVFPFPKTAWNILKTGMRKSVFGGLSLANEMRKGNIKVSDEKFIHHLAEQALAWTTLMVLRSMVFGDDDEDIPFITGSKGKYGSNKYKWLRQNLPPTSIRIGDTWYDYSRIEPFGGMIANTVDMLVAWEMKESGADASKLTKHMFNSFKQNIRDKTFLSGLGDLMKAFEGDYAESLPRYASNFGASWIPNIVRSTLTSNDDMIRDRRNYESGTDWITEQFITKPLEKSGLVKGLPKVDLWGNDIENRNEGALIPPMLWKIISPSLTQPTDMSKGDELLWNWNKNNPNNEYWAGLPSTRQKLAGKYVYMKGDDYYEFTKKSGALAKQILDRAINRGLINYQNPTEKDIKKLKKIFRKARAKTKKEFEKTWKPTE